MKRRTWGLRVGGVVLALLALTPGLVSAQQLAVGTVDTGRIAGEYKEMQQLNEQYSDFQRQQEQRLMERQKVMMLAEADHTKYFDLVQAAAPTDSTKQQIADLEALARKREERYRALTDNKKDRTAEEQSEYDELSKVYTARMGEMRSLQEDVMKAVQGKREELTKVITASLEAAIKSVAEAKNLSVVIAKEAVLYGGTDITTEVLERLNASSAAPPG